MVPLPAIVGLTTTGLPPKLIPPENCGKGIPPEIFNPPLTVGYLGFDCAIGTNGTLGPPIPTHANLEPAFATSRLDNFGLNLTNSINDFATIEKNYKQQGRLREPGNENRSISAQPLMHGRSVVEGSAVRPAAVSNCSPRDSLTGGLHPGQFTHGEPDAPCPILTSVNLLDTGAGAACLSIRYWSNRC